MRSTNYSHLTLLVDGFFKLVSESRGNRHISPSAVAPLLWLWLQQVRQGVGSTHGRTHDHRSLQLQGSDQVLQERCCVIEWFLVFGFCIACNLKVLFHTDNFTFLEDLWRKAWFHTHDCKGDVTHSQQHSPKCVHGWTDLFTWQVNGNSCVTQGGQDLQRAQVHPGLRTEPHSV